MTGLALLFCLAQAPSPLAVVVSSKRPGADAFAGSAASRVHTALLREGVPPGELLDDAAAMKKVKVADVRAHLPAGTPVVTPTERTEQLRLRREGAQLRRIW